MLDNLEMKWGDQYPIVIKSWRDNWERLSAYIDYTKGIRWLIYTTNTVEGYHRQLRKITKNKGVFPNDAALGKLTYLAYRNTRKKWNMALSNWGTTAQQLAIKVNDLKYYRFVARRYGCSRPLPPGVSRAMSI